MGEEATSYKLGHSPAELERLDLQGRLLAPASRALLTAAGVRSGMRVLDMGSGAGDMAFVAAELVGSDGSVVGVDQSAQAVAHATRRADDRELPNVELSVGDVSEPAPGGPYDAITGRWS